MAKVKLTCSERCPVAGVTYLPGEFEVDAKVAEVILRLRPKAFSKVQSIAPAESDPLASAPERRRKKPAKYKRKG